MRCEITEAIHKTSEIEDISKEGLRITDSEGTQSTEHEQCRARYEYDTSTIRARYEHDTSTYSWAVVSQVWAVPVSTT